MTLEQFSNRLYESKILHDYKDGKIDYRKVHDWIVDQEEAITVTHCCMSEAEQLPLNITFYKKARTSGCMEFSKWLNDVLR